MTTKKILKLKPIGEETLLLHFKANKISGFVREHRFHPARAWRFDFAFPEEQLAIEVEGGTWKRSKNRHTTGKGFKDDCEKYNNAVKFGWRVLRFTTDMVTSGHAVLFIMNVLGERRQC